MSAKSRLLAGALVAVLGVVGYFALRAALRSPIVVEKQSEGPVGSPELANIDGIARSRDGRILATVNQNTVALWDAESGQNLRVLENAQNEWIFAPAFSPDGSVLVTPSGKQTDEIYGHLLFWDPATGERLATVDNLSYPGCASFNSAGTLIAVGGEGLYLVDPSAKGIVRQVDRPHENGGIQAVVFSPSGDLLATGGRDGTVKLWQLPDLNLVRTFPVSDPGPYVSPSEGGPPRAIVFSLAFAHDGARLAASTREGSIFVWAVESGKEIVHYDYSAVTGDEDVVLTSPVSFTSNDKWLEAMEQRGTDIRLRLLGAKREKEVDSLLMQRAHVELKAVNVSPTDGSVVFAYKAFPPGEETPPPPKFEVWSVRLR